MAIIKATSKKQYAIESEPLLRILASGIKLTDEVMKRLKVKAGSKDKNGKGVPGDTVNYAYDTETGKVYIYNADKDEAGSILGANKTFTSTGLKTHLMKLAKDAPIFRDGETTGKVTTDMDIKGGVQIRFEVAETPTVVEDTEFFELIFKDAIIAGASDEAETEGEVEGESAEGKEEKASAPKAGKKKSAVAEDEF